MRARIGDVVQAAAWFNPKVRMLSVDLRAAADALLDELAAKAVAHVLVGGVALLSFVEGRNTQVIEVIVEAKDIDRVGWEVLERDHDFARADYRGLRVDLLLADNPVFALVKGRHTTTASFGERALQCATREGLLLLKLYALPSLYRQGKLARAALYETDVLMLHQGAAIDDEALLAELAPHMMASDVAELGRILGEQRARRRFVE